MACRAVSHLGPSGPVATIVCGGRQRPKKCAYCHRDSSRLCDFRLEAGPRGGKTCDVPMCHLHTYGPHVDVDYCRDHRPEEAR